MTDKPDDDVREALVRCLAEHVWWIKTEKALADALLSEFDIHKRPEAITR